METLELRIRRYLLARLRRRAVLDLYEMAAVAGLLEGRFLGDDDGSGMLWVVSDAAKQFLAGARIRDRRIIRRLMGSGGGQQHEDVDIDLFVPDGDAEEGTTVHWAVATPAKPRKAMPSKKRGGAEPGGSSIDFPYVSGLLREHLPAASPLHVAVALLVARAAGTSLPNLAALTQTLRSVTPFVLVKAPVARFEQSLGMMLEDGLLLPYRTTLEDVMRDGPLSGRYLQSRTPRPRQTLKTLAGSAVCKFDDRSVRRQLRQAMIDEPAPIVVADETPNALTPVVTATADLVLECDGFDRAMLADLLHICAGTPKEESLKLMDELALDPESLSLDDLVLSVRPRRSAEQIVTVLTMLVDRFSHDDVTGKDAADGGGSGRGTGGTRNRAKSSAARDEKATPQEVGIEIIEPAAGIEGSTSTSNPRSQSSPKVVAPSITTLSGYGAARDWAIDLKSDLALWRDGNLSWDEMSTKLLLSGPPGTGKTTYAKALCNTLQVPLLVTSVAHWLEPGYLGDVLKRMSAAFELAASRAPAILFIDELDNIGSRQSESSRQHDDYWVSLINRLLQLLDGAAKTEGVVVVAATNLPEKIDAALLRSGRLETHVRIPLPDIETLTGILAHHLGADLPEVLSSAPAGLREHCLEPRKAGDHAPRQLRRTSEKRRTDKVTGVKP